jgi:glycosyltransferase involved in cell wall biosynthesis
MYKGNSIVLILPAKDEAQTLPSVLSDIPQEIDHVIVVDNGSMDATAQIANEHGALVISEPILGYGRACLAALKILDDINPDIVAFADADGSDYVSRLCDLLDPVINGDADLVLEHRIPTVSQALSNQQRFGNRLATSLIHIIWGHLYYDLGPMRAIQWSSLQYLVMKDQDYGWTVEMQIKAIKRGLRICEMPMPYRIRTAGKSKVSKNLQGSIRAGIKILWVIFREALLDGKIQRNSDEFST